MRKTLLASALLLALCGSALAGDINSPPITTSNPPSTTKLSSTQTTRGSAATEPPDAAPGGITPAYDTYLLAVVALRVFGGVLALF